MSAETIKPEAVKKLLTEISHGKTLLVKHKLSTAIDALNHCDPNATRDEWRDVIVSAVKNGIPDEVIEVWSKKGNKHKGHEDDFKNALKLGHTPYFGPGKGINEGTLFFFAKQYGYKGSGGAAWVSAALNELSPSDKQTALAPFIKASSEATPSDEASKPSKEHLDSIAKLWKSYEPPPEASHTIPDKHPYAKAKEAASAYGMRVAPDDAEQYAGWLAVPLYDFAGQLVAIHHISAVPKVKAGGELSWPKYTTPGTMGEAFYTDDLPKKGTKKRVLIVEGIGVAWALRKMYPDDYIVATCGSPRFPKVARAVRSHCGRGTLIVIAQDAGGALGKAQEAAKAVHGAYLTWPGDIASNTGLDDLKPEAAKALIDGVLWEKRRYEGKTAASIKHEPPLEWLVSNVLPRTGQHMVVGKWSVGKTLWGMHLAHCIGEGELFFGLRTKTCHVSHIFLEGQHGLPQRIQAFETHHGKPFSENVYFYRDRFDLRKADDIEALCDEIEADGGKNGLVIVDTLAAASRGAAENTSDGMGELLDRLVRVEDRLGGCVLVLHHPPEGNGPVRARGHSSAPSGADLTITIEGEDPDEKGEISAWKVPKLRDGKKRNKGIRYRIVGVPLGLDKDGEEISGAVLVPLDDEENAAHAKAQPDPKKPKPGGPNQLIAYEALKKHFEDSKKIGIAGAPHGAPCLDYEYCLNIAISAMPGDKGHKKTKAQAAITGLKARHVFGSHENWVWLMPGC